MPLYNYILISILLVGNITTIYFVKKLTMIFAGEDFISHMYRIPLYKELYFILVSGTLTLALYMYLVWKIDLSRLIPILTGALTLLVAFMGIIWFKETLTLNKMLGMAFVILGLFLLSK